MERVCDLEDCDNLIPSDANPRKQYCCDGHASLGRLRRKRIKDKQNKPFIVSGLICPVDGKIFPSQLYLKRGRPKKYDCDGCRQIQYQLKG